MRQLDQNGSVPIRRSLALVLVAAVAMAVALAPAPSARAGLLGVNLIVNGDAELDVGSTDDNTPVTPTAWATTGNFSV